MYQTFINYDEEFEYYSNFLKKYKASSLLELGCGTGDLAMRFIANGFNYIGLDVSKEMLELAKSKNSNTDFIQGDMRDFQLAKSKQACIISGRSTSYLISDKDVMDCFISINKNIQSGGILCFDCIDASKFLPSINPDKKIVHTAEFGDRKFMRESYWSVNADQKQTVKWDSVYYEMGNNNELKEIGEDNSVVRIFFKEEIYLFLERCNFKVMLMEQRPSYAFDTFVIVAQKIS